MVSSVGAGARRRGRIGVELRKVRDMSRSIVLNRSPVGVVVAFLAIAGISIGVPATHTTPTLATTSGEIDQACLTENPFLATSRYARGTSFDTHEAIVAFQDTPDDSGHITLATVGEVGAVYGLAYDPGPRRAVRRGLPQAQLRVTARWVRVESTGSHPEGGSVEPFFEVPDAGNDLHEREGRLPARRTWTQLRWQDEPGRHRAERGWRPSCSS